MPAKTPRGAVDALLAQLSRTASCVTAQPVLASGYRPSPDAYDASFVPVGSYVPLRRAGRSRGLMLFMSYGYRVVGPGRDEAPYAVRPASYRYRLLDRDEREILAYHRHPDGVSPVTYPHLHLSSRIRPVALGADGETVALAEMHLPTGQVSFADVVRLLIAEFVVTPRRSDWEATLRREPELSV